MKTIDANTIIDREKLSPLQWLVFILGFLVFFSDGLDTGIIGFIAPALLDDWGITKPQLAPVLSAALVGMSIGATDKHWWERIANILINSKNKKLIIHLYEKTPSFLSPRIARKRRESKENEFLFQLNNLDLSDEQIAQLRKQIYIVTNSEYILNVDLRQYLNLDKNESTNVVGLETKGNSKAV